MFTAMVEEAIVIVGVLQRKDGGVDERINGFKMPLQFIWQVEIHTED